MEWTKGGNTCHEIRKSNVTKGKGRSVLGIKEDQCRVKERNHWIKGRLTSPLRIRILSHDVRVLPTFVI
jgi:hypothetical protein